MTDTNRQKRVEVILGLLPRECGRLLDVGCGPIRKDYPYAARAEHVTCIDWKLKVIGTPPPNIEMRAGNFLEMDLGEPLFDTIICADVFEHVEIEKEDDFVRKCLSCLRPGGTMVVSVPCAGDFAWLDPYRIRPAIHHALHRIGLYRKTHNGSCDIRKGHKHYTLDELQRQFAPLHVQEMRNWGYFFDPLSSWHYALSRKTGVSFGGDWLARACAAENRKDFGGRAFNIAVAFRKPD